MRLPSCILVVCKTSETGKVPTERPSNLLVEVIHAGIIFGIVFCLVRPRDIVLVQRLAEHDECPARFPLGVDSPRDHLSFVKPLDGLGGWDGSGAGKRASLEVVTKMKPLG